MAYALDKKTLLRVKISCMKLCLSNQNKHSAMITLYQSSFLYASHGDSLKGTISINIPVMEIVLKELSVLICQSWR